MLCRVFRGAEGGGIWLSDKFAEANGIALGDTLRLRYHGAEISGEVVGLIKSGEHMICLADANQVMPDYRSFGFAYISPQKLVSALGFAFYPQIHIRSALSKEELEEAVGDALGYTAMVISKDEHAVYKEAMGEAKEGKTMGSVLPVLFLAIAILTMLTTMHRIAVNEKLQIGTLKALGFHNGRILRHYAAYGFGIGLLGTALGVFLGYWLCSLVMSEDGMMGTYFDMPDWSLGMPAFCPPLLAAIVMLLTLVSWLSVREQLRGTAAEALRPYQPKRMKKSFFERGRGWDRKRFSVKWNLRDVMRHKSRSAMTLLGVTGCMLILVLAAIVLGIVVLYNLGVLSCIERSRELATLKVLGFRDGKLGHLLISQNIWLSVPGVVIGLPAGVGVLHWLLTALAGEYELKLMLGPATYCVSVLLTFGVSLAVGLLVARKSRRIDMAEALKGAE